MPYVVMYCSDTCPFCKNAENRLTKKGVAIEKKNVDENADN